MMSDWDGESFDPWPTWDSRPEDDDFSLDPELLGRVPLTDDGSIFADVYGVDGTTFEDIPQGGFDFSDLNDLLGIPNDDDLYAMEVNDFSDYVPGIDDDLREFPTLEAVREFLNDTGFWDSDVYYDADEDRYYVDVEPSP